MAWPLASTRNSIPASGVALQSLALRHPQAAALRGALAAIGAPGMAVDAAAVPAIQARLATPRGVVALDVGF